MLNSRIKWVASLFALIAVTFSLSAGMSANAEDRSQQGDKGANSQSKEFKSDQPNFSNNREQTLESGMEPVVVQPSRTDVGALVQPGKAALYSAAPELSNIIYRLGAPIMAGPINIYEIWYGTWSTTSTTVPVAKAYQAFTNEFLTAAVGTNQHWAINNTYYQAAKATPATRTTVGNYSTIIQQRVVPTNEYLAPDVAL